MQKFLILGGNGMLGQAIGRSCIARDEQAVALSHAECDITDEASVRRALEVHQPTVIINCAGHTRVDACETEVDPAMLLNGTAVGMLGGVAEAFGARVVHFSTDFVFDGLSKKPWREQDHPNPLSVYGRSKLAGEQALLASSAGHALVVRTSWLFGFPGASFPRTIAERAQSGAALSVVEDQVGSPTFADDLANVTLELIRCGATGTVHVANSGQATWLELARATLELAGINATIKPTTAAAWKAQYPSSAPRPAYSVLDTSRARSILGCPIRKWRNALGDFVQQWRAGSA